MTPPVPRRAIEIPSKTIFVGVAVIGGLWLLARLWPVVLVVSMALVIVGTLNPIVGALQRRGLGRSPAVAITLVALLAGATGIVLVTVPALWAELSRAIHDLPRTQAQVANWLERSTVTTPLAHSVRAADPNALLISSSRHAVEVTSALGTRLAYAATTVALAIYVLVAPERSQAGLYALVPRNHHVRLARVMLNLETIVGGYVRGQLLTSAAIGLYVFVLLSAFGLPNALAFATFAAVADVIPFVGGALTLVPIAVAALGHGSLVMLALVALVILYQEVENRILVPRIYGRVLRLSAVEVTIALLIGGELLGIVGALLALPLAAGLRMMIQELRVELPGQSPGPSEARARDERVERDYVALTEGAPVEEAAVVAIAMADDLRVASK